MIKKIFDEIAAEPGSNKKMEILGSYKDNKILEKVLYLANSPRVKFYIKQIPEYKTDSNSTYTLDEVLDKLNKLSKREVTGHEAQNYLSNLLSSVNKDNAYVIERIIEKDCKIGMGISNINKVFKKLIEETPYMGAKAFEEKLAKKMFENGDYAYSQIKMDGRYCNALIRNGVVDLESRQGEPTIVTGAKFLDELSKFEDCVLNGELTMDGVTRYESNGIIASIIDITGKIDSRTEAETKKKVVAFEKEHGSFQDALSKIRFTIWDTLKIHEYEAAASSRPYSARFGDVDYLITTYGSTMISKVECKKVESYEEAMNHFQEALHRGLEGTILKSIYGEWKDGKPNWQVKMKLEMDVDLEVIDFIYGEKGTKNETVISRILCRSKDGIVTAKAAGLTEKMMKEVTENMVSLKGKIAEIESCGLSKNKNSTSEYALLHPRFKRFRDDKKVADSFEEIQNIENMKKSLTAV